jgi:hypothetical protein
MTRRRLLASLAREGALRRGPIRILAGLSLFLSAGALGFFLSSSLGEDVLRREVERQLGRVLKGEVAIERVRLGLGLGLLVAADHIEVYPEAAGPGLSAERAEARVDLFSLLLGRVRLLDLRVEGARMRIVRRADGGWFPPPLAALARRREADPSREPGLGFLRACEKTTRALLERPLVARHVKVSGASVRFTDWEPGGGRSAPLRLQLEDLGGTLDHRWLTREPELHLRATFVDTSGRRTPVEAEGRRLDDDSLRLAVAATELSLEGFQDYAKKLGEEAALGGFVSGVLSFETPAPENGVLEVDGVARDFLAALPRQDAQVRFESSRAAVRGRVETHPGRLRVEHADVEGEEVAIHLEGVVERPIRDSSRARAELSVRGASLPVVERFVASLPESDRETLQQLLARVESGEIVRVGGSGTTRVAQWRQLLAGELRALPVGFLVGAEVSGLTLATEGRDRLTDLGAVVEWSGDRIELRDVTALWNGEPIPSLTVGMDGVSHLFEGPPREREMRSNAAPLPGLGASIEILRQLGAEREPKAPRHFPPIELEVAHVEHPALRFPLRDARVVVRATDRGGEIDLARGLWAGAPVHGEAVWVEKPKARWSVSLTATPRAAGTAPAPRRGTDAPWMEGRFSVGAVPEGPLALRKLAGGFAAKGSSVYLKDVRADLEPSGVLTGYAGIDLAERGRAGVQLSLELADGDLSRLGGLVGLPADFATGSLELKGSLEGALRPDEPLLAALQGFVSARASEGELRQRVPLVVAMAQATEGFNPFSSRDAVTFESIESVLEFQRGRISTDDFKLEGPMRVFASGSLDVRKEPVAIDAVVGVFLLRQADLVLGNIPIVKELISNKGMIGAYFGIRGPVQSPEVRSLAARSLVESVPDLVKTPFKMLRLLAGRSDREDRGDGRSP